LPVELMTEVITDAWYLPLSSEERITLMRSSALVNSTWADIFDLVSSRDIYLPSPPYFDHFIRRLRAQPHTTPSKGPLSPANLACQSLTIQLAKPDVRSHKYNRRRVPMSAILSRLLARLNAYSIAPNLRRLIIEYLDAGFEDLFQRAALAAVPSQITHLDVRYSFS
ncbi:hypothetical protein DFH07DRAFT_682358, partial [Mycena maculata]